jgi:hypothetical protein
VRRKAYRWDTTASEDLVGMMYCTIFAVHIKLVINPDADDSNDRLKAMIE